MRDFFGMTREQFRAWLEKHAEHEPACGILACSPEIYAEMMAANEKAFKENVDRTVELPGCEADKPAS